MGYEIDFLPVGDESKSGDRIALRYGNLYGPRSEQTVIVVDGGYRGTGGELISHVQQYYGTDSVDVAVATHTDNDHIGGLFTLLEEMTVGELWMHLPWNHSTELSKSRNSQFAHSAYSEALTKSLAAASDLEEYARSRSVPIFEPFTGRATPDGVFTVLGPSEQYYEQLLPLFGDRKGKSLLAKAAEAIRALLGEDYWTEHLTDDGETSAQNNSSVISLLRSDGCSALLTADAGIPALTQIVPLLRHLGISIGDLTFAQVPHHGSKRNVGPTLLDDLLGEKGTQSKIGTAFVSACVNGAPKHPNKKVTNAFLRRGYPVYATCGHTKWHHRNAPGRVGWSTATPLPLYDKVEDDED